MSTTTTTTTTPRLSLRGLVKRYGGLLVTDQVDLDIAQGEIHALIGPNGAGKTSLINQIAGEVRSDAGRIELDGRDVTAWPVQARARAGLGRSYQITAIIPEFTVLENALLAAQTLHGSSLLSCWRPASAQPALVERAEAALAQAGLLALRHRQAGLLAYGQQRQLELAMALAIEPRVLLLDEPMAGLGPAETQDMVALLHGLRGRYAMLLVEHDMQAVFALASVCSVLVYGRVVFRGSPAEVQASAVVREAYLGEELLA